MATFVYHGGDIIHLAGGIHKNERRTAFCQRTVVATGCFALAAFQIEMPHALHSAEAISKKWIEFFQHRNALLQQVFAIAERAQRLYAFGLCIQIPRTQCIELQLLLFVLVNIIHQWQHVLLHAFLKLFAIGRGIIKAAEFFKLIIAEVAEAGIHGHLLALFNQLAVQVVQRFFVLQATLLNAAVHRFPFAAVFALQKLSGLLHGIFLTLVLNGHAAGDLAKLLLQYAQLCLQRNVFFPKQFNAFAYAAQIRVVQGLVELGQVRIVHQFFIQRIGIGLNLGLNFHHEKRESIFQRFVFCVAGHFNLAPAGIFANGRFHFAAVLQPFF